jgi:hypothetical protein
MTTKASARRHTHQVSLAPSPDDIRSAVRTALDTVSPAVRAGFVAAVTDSDAAITEDTAALDETLWGPAPSTARTHTAALQTLKNEFVARRALLDTALNRTEVAELLGVSPQAVLDRLADGDLLGLKDGREWRIPIWQIHAGAERGFLPGLAALRRAFPGGLVALSHWATAPNADLDGSTPADALAAGRVDDVVAVAAAATAAAW